MSREGECRKYFERVLADRSPPEATAYSGQNKQNWFDPGFGLEGCWQFQYGDFRVNLRDRIVVVETESSVSGTLRNLVKYLPFCRPGCQSRPTLTVPILLLHVLARLPNSPRGEDLSSQRLWDFLWGEMKADLWKQDPPMLLARRYAYVKNDCDTLQEACDAFGRCLTEDLPSVCRDIFGYNGPLAK